MRKIKVVLLIRKHMPNGLLTGSFRVSSVWRHFLISILFPKQLAII
jgi:hypothetical protein